MELTLIESAKKGDVDAVRKMVEQGVNMEAIDKDGKTALGHAMELGNTEIVNYLQQLPPQVGPNGPLEFKHTEGEEMEVLL